MQLSKTLLTAAAVATFVAGAALLSTGAQAKEGHEKCAGIVKAGQNDCAASGHSCAGQSKADGGSSWVYLPTGTCAKIVGGTVVAE